ncbi:DUF2570 family protein [Acinetobacter rathckeae]|uniref:DUF2570 family protein n=1 Tax=Acinetobacter rathckeae TaxID=2605272 RepID=UPI0018A29822|nr:DUF2570 family protein [Acinetobacter rathckeae]MBF7687745.1 DUF2570 family protein [Acinetobacter rathckeae]MBF7688032.1 DUF2570 family protein [Acinetobacter rathckeae]
MITLALIRSFIKPILILLAIFSVCIGFKYYNHLQQSIGTLEHTIKTQNDTITEQKQIVEQLKQQMTQQRVVMNQLQAKQEQLNVMARQRQNSIKEVFAHDQISKSWGSQPVPESIIRMLKPTDSNHSQQEQLSSTQPMPTRTDQH